MSAGVAVVVLVAVAAGALVVREGEDASNSAGSVDTARSVGGTAEIKGVAVVSSSQPDVEFSLTLLPVGQVVLPEASLAPGDGVNVSVEGVLDGPAELRLVLPDPPTGDAVPAAWHVDNDGATVMVNGVWDPRSNELVISTTEFSGWIPDWLDPISWVAGTFDFISDTVTGRTDPPGCGATAPDWATFTPPVGKGTVHSCFQSNVDADTGALRAEVLFKSNRRGFQAVTVPAGTAYTWVEGQPEWIRPSLAWLAGNGTSSNVLLPGGMSTSFGFNQPALSTDVGIAIYTTPGTILVDGAMAALGIAAGTSSSDIVSVAVAINSCALSTYGIDILQGDFSFGGDVDSALTSLLTCVLGVLPKLADPGKAQQAIVSLDNAHLIGAAPAGGRGEQIASLVDSANKLGGIAERAAAAVALASAGVDLWDKVLDNFAPNTDAHLSLSGLNPPAAADEAVVADLVDCENPCEVTGQISFSHPSWGPSTLVTYLSESSDVGPTGIVVVDTDGIEQWRWELGDTNIYELQPPSRRTTSSLHARRFDGLGVSIDEDTIGHLFVEYNPGRYNGVIVLSPTADGFDDLGSLPTGDSWGGGFYYTELIDINRDGQVELLDLDNDCNPSCAGGTILNEVLVWNGTEYSTEMDLTAAQYHFDSGDFYGQFSDDEPLWSGCTPDGSELQDGVWMGYAADLDPDGLELDLACDYGWQLSIDVDPWTLVTNDNPQLRHLEWATGAYVYGFDEELYNMIGPEPVSALLSGSLYLDPSGRPAPPVVVYVNGGEVSGLMALHRP